MGKLSLHTQHTMGSSKPAITAVLFFLLVGLNTGSVSAVTYLNHQCPNTTLFTPNSTYQRNLNSLLSSLSSNATRPTGFYNVSVGAGADVAYGLFLCRGDVSTDVCKDCVDAASVDLVEKCPKQRTSLVWYDECMVRYSNRPFFSTVATEPSLQLLNTGNVSNPDRFMELLGTTIKDATGRAAADQSGKKFSTGEANFTSFQPLYTLAQCTPDLSKADCTQCLDTAVGYLPSCCSGRPGGRVLFPSCNVRYELYPFYNRTALPPPPPVLSPPPTQAPASEAKGKGKGKISVITVVAIVVPIAVSVVLFIIGYCILTRRAKRQYSSAIQEDNDDDITNAESLQFDLSTIGAATNNFSDENKLGEGGFGAVYKGTLPDGQEIAVKRLSKSSGQGAQEFKNEVVLVAKLQHRNLVRLLGFCLEGQEKILVYEFVPNKSLDYFLFDPEKQALLDWSRRYKIIGGIARGILYLHEDSRLRIIHRDLKASNILLDGDMNAKISDFGMARIFGVDQTQGNTSRIVGTYGYMSPEYAMQGQFSVKSDVYSFGVLILEIISGKKNSNFYQEGAEDLISYAWKLWRDETPLSLMDPVLRDSYSRNEVIRCIHIALLCVQEDPAERPALASIILMLNSYSVTLALPHQPTSFHFRGSVFNSTTKDAASDKSTSRSVAISVDEASITEVHPR